MVKKRDKRCEENLSFVICKAFQICGHKNKPLTNFITLDPFIKAGRPARTYIQQLYVDTECSPEVLPEAMNDR